MKVAVDTNVLLRAVLQLDDGSEDARQSRVAGRLLREADAVFVSLPTLCEFVWVLASAYRFDRIDLHRAVRALVSAENVHCDRSVVDFGLAVLQSGGDFADGVIAQSGFRAGADRFVSFDKRAVRLITQLGSAADDPDAEALRRPA